MRELRLHIIPLTNEEKDAAGRPLKAYDVTPEAFGQLVERVNGFFEPAKIRFLFDPDFDWAPMAHTIINTDADGQREAANAIAARIPGKVVCFLRWGRDTARTGNGNAYPPPGAGAKPVGIDDVVQNYVALPNQITPGFGLLNQGDGAFMAHELGHYLGLYHTFPGWTDRKGPVFGEISGDALPTRAQADQAVIDFIGANGGTIAAMDGDSISDTAPDPSPVLYAAHNHDICAQRDLTVRGTLAGKPVSFTFSPDPRNIMSYFSGCPPVGVAGYTMHFSAKQIERMASTLSHSARRTLIEPPSFGARSLQVRNAISRKPDQLDVVASDTSGRVWFTHWAPTKNGGRWAHWRPILDDISAAGAPVGVVARDANKLDIFIAGNDGKTYTAAWDRDMAGGQWRGWWNILTGAIPSGGAITAVSRGADKLDIFIVSTDGGIYTAAWEPGLGEGKWRGWWRIGDLVAQPGSSVAAVARDRNKLDIFVAGADGKTYSAAWDANVAGGWRGWWNILTGAVPPGGAITAVSRHPNKLDLFLVSSDGGIYTAAWDANVAGGWRGWFRVGAQTAKPGAPVAVVSRDPNKLDLFVAGTDGKTYTNAWDANAAGGWRGWSNILTGAVKPGSAIAAVSRAADQLDLFLVSHDGAVYTAAWEADVAEGKWRGWWKLGS